MLPKNHRLPLRTELKRVQKNGKLIQGKLFSLIVAPHLETLHFSRFAFIVSTKIHKKAVGRNRIRRLLAEAIRSKLGEIKPGFDGVFLVKKAVVSKQLGEIKGEVEELMKKAEIIERKM